MFGVWAPGEEVSKLTYFGLYALQHRGQESAGIAVSNGHKILVYKDMGLVSQVFHESHLSSLRGHLAVGHTRYSTTGASVWENAQPTFGRHRDRHGRARPQRQPHQHRRARRPAATPPTPRGRARPGRHHRHRADHRAARRQPRPHAGGHRAGGAAAAARRLLAGLHGRDHPVRRPRPPGHPAAGPGPARPRLGRRERDRGAGHRRRLGRARGRARRVHRDRRERAAHRPLRRGPSPRAASSSTSTSPVRTPPSPAAACTRPGWRWGGGWPGSIRSRPTSSSRPRSRAPRRRSATPRPAASRTARGW